MKISNFFPGCAQCFRKIDLPEINKLRYTQIWLTSGYHIYITISTGEPI